MAKDCCHWCSGTSGDGAPERLSTAMLGAVQSRTGEVGSMVTEEICGWGVQGCESNGGPMLVCVLMACARIE